MDITTLEPLHPVLHLILDFLKTDHPQALLPVSKDLYKELMPAVYERVEVDGQGLGKLLHGLVQYSKELDLNIARPVTETDGLPGTDDVTEKDQPAEDSHHQNKVWDFGPRKGEALSHIKYLRLENLKQDHKVDEMMETFFGGCYNPLFSSLKHLSLSREMTEYLWPPYIETDHRFDRQQGIFINLTAIDRPKTLCVEWPEEWRYYTDHMGLPLWDNDDEHCAMGLGYLLSAMADTKVVYLHVPHYKLEEVKLDIENEAELLEVVIIVKDPASDTSNLDQSSPPGSDGSQSGCLLDLEQLIDDLWTVVRVRHVGILLQKNVVVPVSPATLERALNEYQSSIKEMHRTRWEQFRNGVKSTEEIDNDLLRCPCGR
ncbi:hypothetical protein IAU59_001183 [Kwoniella sp. CBS 9459]